VIVWLPAKTMSCSIHWYNEINRWYIAADFAFSSGYVYIIIFFLRKKKNEAPDLRQKHQAVDSEKPEQSKKMISN
jgi:hypothetical protein